VGLCAPGGGDQSDSLLSVGASTQQPGSGAVGCRRQAGPFGAGGDGGRGSWRGLPQLLATLQGRKLMSTEANG